MTDTSPPGPEHDLPGMIRRHLNGALYARRELAASQGVLLEAPWVAITAVPNREASFLFDEDMEDSARVAVMPGTPAAYAADVAPELTVNDREPAVDQLARALFAHWVTDYAYSSKPWEQLRPEHQRAFRRRGRAVLPVLERWHSIAQQLAAAASEGGEHVG